MQELKQLLEWKQKEPDGLWEARIQAELDFLFQVFRARQEPVPEPVLSVFNKVYETLQQQGAITKQQVLEAEKQLQAYESLVKEYQVFCIAHAHIDMNWMWGMPETVGIVIDTFQTMLNLLEEYPSFIFSQSQSATYRIIEQYAPSMLPEIRRYVKEGRWEVTASTWVENDKNMSGTEAMARHILYTKQYLQKLFQLEPEELTLDFEPDTFGHSAFVPEVLHRGGIRYYFHCRGNDQEEVYRWRALSGEEVLVYREPNWYLGPIRYGMLSFVPGFCQRNHTMAAAVVYGVGDHGGGPTRRDLERILAMQTWPLLPQIRFARLTDFFKKLEENRDQYPVVQRELNCVFTGCYTTQSRIKQMNRRLEDSLYDSEALSAMEYLGADTCSNPASYQAAWETTLFNQFHDILPGSCVQDTVFYALGKGQEAMSYSIGNANRAMKALGDCIDTAAQGFPQGKEFTSEGAGTGYNTMNSPMQGVQAASSGWKITETCRGRGNIRAYTLFNTTQYHRKETVQLTVWDWTVPLEGTILVDWQGNEIPFQTLEQDQVYWQHTFHKLTFLADVPPFGYANYYLKESEQMRPLPKHDEPRVHRMEDGFYVLENDHIRAKFCTETLKLCSLYDKESGQEYIDPAAPSGYFRFVWEQDSPEYSAWMIGRYRKVEDLNSNCILDVQEENFQGIRQNLRYRMQFYNSSLDVDISLDQDARMLRYSVNADWHESGAPGRATPQLQFCVPFGYDMDTARCDVPGGTLDRPPQGHDVPLVLYGAAVSAERSGCLMLTSDCKYGYRFEKRAMQISLVRGAYAPDPYPDIGNHHWELGLGLQTDSDPDSLTEAAVRFSHPIYTYSNSVHTGSLPQRHSFCQVEGARVETLKRSENQEGLVLRLHNSSGQNVGATVCTDRAWQSAQTADLLERADRNVAGQGAQTEIPLSPWELQTIVITY